MTIVANLVFSDNFNRANTAAGGTGNGWLDANTLFSVNSNQLNSLHSSGSAYADSPPSALLRPSSETPSADVRVSCKIDYNFTQFQGLVLRKVAGATPTYLLATLNQSDTPRFYVYTIENGAASPQTGGPNVISTAIPPGEIILDVSVIGNAYTATIIKASDSSVYWTGGGTISNSSAVSAAGASGVIAWDGPGDTLGPRIFDDFSSYQLVDVTDPTTLTVTGSASLTIGSGATYTATLNAAATSSVSFTPSATGFSAGFVPSPVTFSIGDTAKTFTVTSSTAGSGSIGGTASGLTVVPRTGVTSSSSVTPPTTATVTGSASINVGVASTYTVTLNAAATTGFTFTPSLTGVSGTTSGAVSFSIGDTAKTFTVTPSATASGVSVGGSGGGLTVTPRTGITVAATASFVIAPTTFPVGSATPFTITGTNTSWTTSTTLSLAGGTGTVSKITGVLVNPTNQTITGFLNPGLAAGSLTISNSTDSSTASVTATKTIIGKITFDGDSLMAGQYTTGENTINATRVATTMNQLGPTYTGQNIAVSGQTIVNMQGRISSFITPFYDSSKLNYLVCAGGHNDVAGLASGQPNTKAVADSIIAQVKTRIQNYLAAVRSACPNMKIFWSTMLPSAHPIYPPWFDYAQQNLNDWIKANYISFGIQGVCDIAANPVVGIPGSEYDPTNYQPDDKTHPLDPGARIIGTVEAKIVTNFINGIGTAGVYPTIGQVLQGVVFGPTSNLTGNLTLPGAGQVRTGIQYGAGGTEFTGNVSLPGTTDVRNGVQFGTNGTQYTGSLTVGASGPLPGIGSSLIKAE